MIRKIHLTHHKNKNRVEGFIDIQHSEIDGIVNYSVDVMYCSILNKIDKTKIDEYIKKIMSKIRYGGQVTLVVIDIHNICQLYINKMITDDMFFDIIADHSNTITENKIMNMMIENDKFELIGCERNQQMVALSFGRKNHD